MRSGCFCAQPYVARLLGLADEERSRGPGAQRPGMVRISLGVYNSRADVDVAVDLIARIARGDYRGRYRLIPETGAYETLGLAPSHHRS